MNLTLSHDQSRRMIRAFNKGARARALGERVDTCPFPPHSPRADQWVEGWITADLEIDPGEPEPFEVRCQHCGRVIEPDELYCYCQENILTDHGSQVIHVAHGVACS